MIKIFSSILICLSLMACSATGTGSGYRNSGSSPNTLIMGEDADRDTIRRDSRVFRRVLGALSNQLNDDGFKVYDETAITLDDYAQGRVRRTDAEIIDIARSVNRPPIDVAVIFSIYARTQDKGYTTKVRTRIEGRILNVRTGRRLGNFEVESPRSWNASPNCNYDCLLEVVGKNSRIIANDLGAVLSEKLGALVGYNDRRPTSGNDNDSGLAHAYNLIFDGFNPDEMGNIEDYLEIFSGYKSHRPTYSSMRRAEYWYESRIKSAKLNRNLHKMLAELDLHGLVTFADNGFTVKKITLRGKKRPNQADYDW